MLRYSYCSLADSPVNALFHAVSYFSYCYYNHFVQE